MNRSIVYGNEFISFSCFEAKNNFSEMFVYTLTQARNLGNASWHAS